MDKELIILEQIQNNPQVNQRDLASIAEASLGMTNAILKRFATKGLITIQKINNRNIRYALTPVGMNEVKARSWSYFKRTIKNVVVYQDAITEIVQQAKKEGFKCIILVGNSDFEFIIEHACYKNHIIFKLENNIAEEQGCFYLIKESPNTMIDEKENCFYLNTLMQNDGYKYEKN